MPEFTVKEVRLPELHLPEIKRDEIVRALSGVRLPDVDLARARQATLKVPTVAVTSADVGRLLAAGAAVARFVRPAPNRAIAPWNMLGRRSRSPLAMIVRPKPRRSRRPLALGLIVVIALAVWAVLRRPEARRRLELASQDARERFAAWRAQDLRPETAQDDGGLPGDAVASTEAEGFVDATDDAGAQTVADLTTRAAESDGVPAFEERPAAN